MRRVSRVIAAGADFRLLGARRTMLQAAKHVVSLCAVRSGVGKSPATRRIASLQRGEGLSGLRSSDIPCPTGIWPRYAVRRS
jgi:predicted GTPase